MDTDDRVTESGFVLEAVSASLSSGVASGDLDSQLVDEIAEFTHDPLGYVLFAFPWGEAGELQGSAGPRRWQARLLADMGEWLRDPSTRHQPFRAATVSGHGIGKSALIGMIVKWALDTCEGCKVVVTSNTERQTATKLWPEISKWARLAITNWHKATATSLMARSEKLEREWRADAVSWSENNTEAFAGLHNYRKRLVVVIDEASKVDDKVWEVIQGALTDEDTEIFWLVFGNGTRATGRFRECFRKHAEWWHGYQIDSREVEGTNLAEIRRMLDECGGPGVGEETDYFKVRVRGMFPSMSEKQFLSEADVRAAVDRWLKPGSWETAPIVLTCDPAWTGSDKIVIGALQGLRFRILEKIARNDNDAVIAEKVARWEDVLNRESSMRDGVVMGSGSRAGGPGVVAVNVDGGFGTGIVSFGRTWGRDWNIVWFGGASSDPAALNKRAEMWNGIKNWLKAGGSIENDQELIDDLLGPEIVDRPDGKLVLESKASMKSRGLPSPNCGDALGLGFAVPVVGKGSRIGEEDERQWLARMEEERREREYDSAERWLGGI